MPAAEPASWFIMVRNWKIHIRSILAGRIWTIGGKLFQCSCAHVAHKPAQIPTPHSPAYFLKPPKKKFEPACALFLDWDATSAAGYERLEALCLKWCIAGESMTRAEHMALAKSLSRDNKLRK